ncbi:hypothetical protein [Rhodococcus daqingensis]|uniref:Uncharacterized protein n=1 Tax=Rhodococcus daqingensis TaxID=2479363 RepID=A0ABW2RRZ4_9NOCA
MDFYDIPKYVERDVAEATPFEETSPTSTGRASRSRFLVSTREAENELPGDGTVLA